jgi:polyphosphate kinase 2 (PPK2 family)
MIKLAKISSGAPKELNKEKIEAKTLELAKKIGELVEIMMAQKKHSLLVVFQGMDASGKDGAFKNVFQFVPHAAVTYKSYGKPTAEEFAHDFLWRIHKNAPAKGTISASIRSHYEDILIQRVHDWIDDKRVAVRMDAINAYERLLQEDNDTVVLKFFTHISPERQLEKLAERIEKVEKNWKHKDGDWQEHMLWDKYMKAYEYAINKSAIPWTIVQADERWYRDYIVAEKVHKELVKMKVEYVKLPADSIAHEVLKTYKATLPKSEAEANNAKKAINLVDAKELNSENKSGAKSKKVTQSKSKIKSKTPKEKEVTVAEKSEIKRGRKAKPSDKKVASTSSKRERKSKESSVTIAPEKPVVKIKKVSNKSTSAPTKRGRKPKATVKSAASAPSKKERNPKVETKKVVLSTPVKRGRKPKAVSNAIIPAKRGRKPNQINENTKSTILVSEKNVQATASKRGRKPKLQNEVVSSIPAKRGRKPKLEVINTVKVAAKRGRRPIKVENLQTTGTPLKRGRKPGTTKLVKEVTTAKRGRKPIK